MRTWMLICLQKKIHRDTGDQERFFVVHRHEFWDQGATWRPMENSLGFHRWVKKIATIINVEALKYGPVVSTPSFTVWNHSIQSCFFYPMAILDELVSFDTWTPSRWCENTLACNLRAMFRTCLGVCGQFGTCHNQRILRVWCLDRWVWENWRNLFIPKEVCPHLATRAAFRLECRKFNTFSKQLPGDFCHIPTHEPSDTSWRWTWLRAHEFGAIEFHPFTGPRPDESWRV